MQITGKVFQVGETIQKTEKFKVRELIVETADNPNYVQYIKIEAGNDKCDLLNNIKVGSEVEVDFNLNGRKYVNKENVEQFFVQLSLWKINVLATAGNYEYDKPVDVTAGGEDDDLPF